jgi:hypothetical protein
MKGKDEERAKEARRVLERIGREGDMGFSQAAESVRRAHDHFAARDADQDDWAELWGTRIARVLALCFAIVLIIWLIGYLPR